MLFNHNTNVNLRDKRLLAVGPVLLLVTFLFWHFGLPQSPAGFIHHTTTLDNFDVAPISQVTAEEDGYTIITPTSRRPDILPKFIEHYATGNFTNLRRIILLWNDAENDVPEAFQRQVDAYPVPVLIEHRENSLNSRFRYTDNLKTRYVLSLDDDLLLEANNVEFGYRTWKDFGQKRMVGYVARASDDEGHYRAGRLKRYSMVLTNFAFYHSHWMDVYWSDDATQAALREYVDTNRNCEDILMAFTTSHHTRQSPYSSEKQW